MLFITKRVRNNFNLINYKVIARNSFKVSFKMILKKKKKRKRQSVIKLTLINLIIFQSLCK